MFGRRPLAVFLAAVLAVSALAAQAVAVETDVYTQQVDVYQYSIGGTIAWNHTYDHSADPVASVALTILADDVDLGEQDAVWIKDSAATWHNLGVLQDTGYYTNYAYHPGPGNPNQPVTATTFQLEPSWLDGLPVEVRVASSWGVEIETATLQVTRAPVPEPSPFVLLGMGAVGLLAFAWRRRKRTTA